MFEVTKHSKGWIFDKVELTAITEMAGNKVFVGGRPPEAVWRSYCFPTGSKVLLHFLRWRRFRQGQKVDLATVLNHAAVQSEILAGKL